MSRKLDTEFMSELNAAAERKPRFAANLLLVAIVCFVAAFFFWASRAEIDEVTRGIGTVVPSSQVQIVQNLEGGIVSEILVKEGDWVPKGKVLVIIDDTQFRSRLGGDLVKRQTYQAMAARLKAELNGKVPVFPEELMESESELVKNELALYHARQRELERSIAVLESQKEQKTQRIKSLQSKVKQLQESYDLGMEEIEITKPLVESGATPKIDLIRLQREINEIENALLEAKIAIPQAKAARLEIENKIEERKATFMTRSMAELNEVESNLENLQETMVASEDRLRRTKVVSPVSGTIKQVFVNTIGGVITPGMNIVEIVPDDDSLLIEAKVNPSDVAFLHPDQEAKVKITAYDYSIYGTLDGVVEQISADTIIDHQGNSYYEILIRTKQSKLSKTDQSLQIIPGMVAEVDILTGHRTVLTYLMKPILRAKGRALRER